ncbi:AraC family transcriptional regulator ligand-binding domain-containing protein [Nocardia arthritidis]|uniref:AraC family transcriptional regulator ligand-binding domain-containing protein n=1 Tax=Nocardia arthritidis TaxID=228602 RepID=UPI000A019A8D|nr:AraC family transcriptional regulator ligand-binding domain-containing protein [Nocardia arthritidis]
MPVRVRFRQAAPRRHDQFVETFGTTRIEFGTPTDQLVFRAADLAQPLTTADPMLETVGMVIDGLVAPGLLRRLTVIPCGSCLPAALLPGGGRRGRRSGHS